MFGDVARQALDLDLDTQSVVGGLGEDPVGHEAALGQQLEGARQHGRLDIGFETVTDGGGVALKR